MLRTLRQHQNHPGKPSIHALLVLGLPKLLQREDRNPVRKLESPTPEKGDRDLPLPHQPQERFQHEAPPRSQNQPKSAWFMLHRIRQAWEANDGTTFSGPVEVDESYFGGKRRNMSLSKRKALTGRGAKGKTAVVAIKDRKSKKVRAKVVENTDQPTLQASSYRTPLGREGLHRRSLSIPGATARQGSRPALGRGVRAPASTYQRSRIVLGYPKARP